MSSPFNGIDWETLNTLERLCGVTLMSGEAKTLTAEEVGDINSRIRHAAGILDPVLDKFKEAKTRFQDKVMKS